MPGGANENLKNSTQFNSRRSQHKGNRNSKQRKEPFRNKRPTNVKRNDHRALANIYDVESVELEQAVRDLNCFEALSDDNEIADLHRARAVEYLEGLLTKWCRKVEDQASAQIYRTEKKGKRTTESGTVFNSASIITSKSDQQTMNQKPNVWHRPTPASVLSATTDPSNVYDSSLVSGTLSSVNRSPVAALLPFGSYQLGVHSTESDLDLLALVPPYVHRSDFFTSLVQLLQEDDRCQQVHSIPSAYTPVIKFEYNCGKTYGNKKLQIDLVFARVSDATKLKDYHKMKALEKNQFPNRIRSSVVYKLDDTDLQDLDEAGIRSLNGARVSQMILEYVPDVPKFQTILRAVKHWAVVHGIYSNVLGFLGGVNWAIMTAYICRQFPNLDAASTLRVFFHTFASWQWNCPVMLFPTVADTPPITNCSMQARAVYIAAWNPQTNPRDGLHIMPIITPAYPSMNSSYNVDMPQLRRITEEMVRATNILDQRHPKKAHQCYNIYRELFAPTNFFDEHRHFLRVDIMAGSEQDFVEWFRLVESRIRVLISNLDTPQVQAWPFARFFKVTKSATLQKCFFIGLRFLDDTESVDVPLLTMDFVHKVNCWEGRKPGMVLSMKHVMVDAIPYYVWEEIRNSSHSNSYEYSSLRCSEQSVDSGNTAPATDDEDDELNSCQSVEVTESFHNIPANNLLSVVNSRSPTKKCRVNNTKINKTANKKEATM